MTPLRQRMLEELRLLSDSIVPPARRWVRSTFSSFARSSLSRGDWSELGQWERFSVVLVAAWGLPGWQGDEVEALDGIRAAVERR